MMTRFQARMRKGQTIKDIMENPLIMEKIIIHLYEPVNDHCHTLMKMNLYNLKMVFKADETNYVLNKFLLHVKMDEVYIKRFYFVALNILKYNNKFHTIEERIKNMVWLFSHFVNNREIINRKQPNLVSLKRDILGKLDRFNTECPQFQQIYGSNFTKLLQQ